MCARLHMARESHLAKDEVGTRHMLAAIRTFVNPADPTGLEQFTLQDAITVTPTAFWQCPKSLIRIRPVRGQRCGGAARPVPAMPDFKNAFGAKGQVRSAAPPHRHGAGLGRQSRKDAFLSRTSPAQSGPTGSW